MPATVPGALAQCCARRVRAGVLAAAGARGIAKPRAAKLDRRIRRAGGWRSRMVVSAEGVGHVVRVTGASLGFHGWEVRTCASYLS